MTNIYSLSSMPVCHRILQTQKSKLSDFCSIVRLQSGKPYHCFCSPERLTRVQKALQKSEVNTGYDRHCLHVSQEETKERIAKGESSIIRLKVMLSPLSSILHSSADAQVFHSANDRSPPEGLTQTDLVYDAIHYQIYLSKTLYSGNRMVYLRIILRM
jgi:hypothetical protein